MAEPVVVARLDQSPPSSVVINQSEAELTKQSRPGPGLAQTLYRPAPPLKLRAGVGRGRGGGTPLIDSR